MIVTRTPFRMSFVGGGSDLPFFYNKHEGAVVSTTINKYMYICVNPRLVDGVRAGYSITETVEHAEQLQHDIIRNALEYMNIPSGIEVVSVSDIPKGTGLGSSGAFTVGLVKALDNYNGFHNGENSTYATHQPGQAAGIASHIEMNMCDKACGLQDQYASAYGGLRKYTFKNGNVASMPLNLGKSFMKEFEEHLLLFYMGTSREADTILKDMSKGDGKINQLKSMAHLARLFATSLQMGDLERAGKIMDTAWEMKKKMSSKIANKEINRAYDLARDLGAWGGKVAGAGGGGFMFYLAPPNVHNSLIKSNIGTHVPFKFEDKGSQVIYMEGLND